MAITARKTARKFSAGPNSLEVVLPTHFTLDPTFANKSSTPFAGGAVKFAAVPFDRYLLRKGRRYLDAVLWGGREEPFSLLLAEGRRGEFVSRLPSHFLEEPLETGRRDEP
jgi:hypothetical protein